MPVAVPAIVGDDVIRLRRLIQDVTGAEITGSPEIEISGVEYDSRQVKEGSLFFAVKGYQRDGYDFVENALANGAVAVMGERDRCDLIETHVHVPDMRRAMATVSAAFYGYPGLALKSCGVTGTNGKTTTCFMIKKIMEARDKTVGMVTSQVYDTGREVFRAERTTPESLDLQRLLYLMKRNNCVNAVIEVSSHALLLHRVDHINFRVGVFTNLTRDHLDFHETMEAYLQAKARLLDRLEGELSYAVLNLDVPEFRPLFGRLDCSHISYSLQSSEADVFCSDYEFRPDGTTFNLVTPMGIRTISVQLPGRFNLINAVAAAAAGLAAGVDLDNVVAGLEAARPVPGRFNYVDHGQPFGVYVDYAHTPDAIARLCEAARELTEGRLLLLFGCGGDRDKGKRPMMGRAAVESADYVVLTSDNPRSEDPLAIIEDVRPGLSGDAYAVVPDRREAVAAILKHAEAGDAVLLAGKGAEPYQEIKGEREPFSDAEEAGKVLAQMGYTPSARDDER